MAVVSQTWDGAQIATSDQSTVKSEYYITDEGDEFLAWIALNAATAATVGDLVKKSVTIDRRHTATSWLGTVEWGAFTRGEVGDPGTYSFDTGGGTAHKQQSIATVSSTAAPGMPAAPNFQGAIGVSDDGVDGVDVPAPAYSFEETHFFSVATISAAYKLTLFSLTGAMNNAAWKGFAIGECMFMGAAGSLKDSTKYEINYKFKGKPNQTSFAAGPITVPLKRGHDHLWLRYRETVDATAGHLTRRPVAAYVEQVSPLGNMVLLGIGS